MGNSELPLRHTVYLSNFVKGASDLMVATEVCYIAHAMVASVPSLRNPASMANASTPHMDGCWDSIWKKNTLKGHLPGHVDSYEHDTGENDFKSKHTYHCMKTEH